MEDTQIQSQVSPFGTIDQRITETQLKPDVYALQRGVIFLSGTGKRSYGKQLEKYLEDNVVNLIAAYPQLVVQLRDSIQVFPNIEDLDQVPTTLTGLQNRVKWSFAFSSDIGLLVGANGESVTSVLGPENELFLAGIEAPTAAPTVVDDGSGNLTDTKWMVYAYVYAATSSYPLVENTNTINGSVSPRSNPSPLSPPFQITAGGNRKNLVTCTKTTRNDIDAIWLFRTELFSTSDLAQTAADAGLMYYIGEAINDGSAGTVDISDDTLSNIGNSVIELDNFVAPTFRYVIYEDPYYWGFGNDPFIAEATWDGASPALITISGDDKFFGGRDSFYVRFEGVTTNGVDGNGTFRFTQLSSTTANIYTTDPASPRQMPGGNGSGQMTIQGPSTVLYRSKRRNPFSWGITNQIGNVTIPQLWSLRVGGGIGTAIAVIPDTPILKLDTEQQAQCITYNLRAAGTDQFASTKRVISRVYSTSCHFSQFVAQANNQVVLWSIDYKNFAILQSNGDSVSPVSGPLPILLKALTKDKLRQSFAHGIYDPQTEVNALWLSTEDSIFTNNICIYQHAPTGFWGILNDYDILCSNTIESTNGEGRQTWIGTESGFLGRAFVKDIYNSFLPLSGLATSLVDTATNNSITQTEGSFNTTDDGIVGNYVLWVSANGLQTQIAIISGVTSDTITVDKVQQANGDEGVIFDPIPVAGDRFYIGVIECKLRKYYDFGDPTTDKYLPEAWITATNTDIDKLRLLYYPEREETPTAEVRLYKDDYSEAYYQKLDIPGQLRKTHGFEVVERGYSAFEFISLALKPSK